MDKNEPRSEEEEEDQEEQPEPSDQKDMENKIKRWKITKCAETF